MPCCAVACLVVLWCHFIICVCMLAAIEGSRHGCHYQRKGWSGGGRMEGGAPQQNNQQHTIQKQPHTLQQQWGQWPLTHSGMYLKLSRGEGVPNQVAFHKQLYQDHHGPVPDDCVIHHIDNTLTNNNLSNLQQLTRAAHNSLHQKGSTKRRRGRGGGGAGCHMSG